MTQINQPIFLAMEIGCYGKGSGRLLL